MTLLQISDLTRYFGGLCAVSGFNLHLKHGELLGLIGPNGAGKTTLFNLISGIYNPSSGHIVFSNFDITGLPSHKISNLGIARTFQNIRIFNDMSVIDNVKAASRSHVEYGLLSAFFHPPSFREKEYRVDEYATRLLKILGIHARANERAGSLPYGLQRRLEIARALATSPKLLLLDEPAAGMNPKETAELIQTILWIKKEFDLTILIIEHNMHVIMNISERILAMDFGETIASGTPHEMQSHPRVIEAYLGRESLHAS
jgi:branched-chain amino acid transport system ATP-binding protein